MIILLDGDFPKKSGSVTHNQMWAPNTMLSFRKTNELILRKLRDRRKDGQMNRRTDRKTDGQMVGLTDGRTDGWTDPILQDPSGRGQGSKILFNKMRQQKENISQTIKKNRFKEVYMKINTIFIVTRNGLKDNFQKPMCWIFCFFSYSY